MDANQPRKTSSAFEYFLYTAILAETGLAALIYKVIFRSGELVRFRVYFAIFYFAFLGWAIAQLNMLHRDRVSKPERPAPELADLELPHPKLPELEPAVELGEDNRPTLGLSSAQLVIVVVVFATAVATFSWALRFLH